MTNSQWYMLKMCNARCCFVLCVLSQLALFAIETLATNSTASKFTLAPIALATANSPTFALVGNVSCNSTVVAVVYKVYSQNRNLFDACVADSNYHIFPYTGTAPTHTQIGELADSAACGAILTALVLSDIPECDISTLALRAAAESLIKVGVDVQMYPKDRETAVPSSQRFNQLINWRRDVNLASAKGKPCDSASQLYAEYAANLKQATTHSTVRLNSDLTVEYKLKNGTIVRGVGNVTTTTASKNSSSSSKNQTSANQVAGYIANDTNTTTGAAAPSAWSWRMSIIVIVALLRLAQPLL